MITWFRAANCTVARNSHNHKIKLQYSSRLTVQRFDLLECIDLSMCGYWYPTICVDCAIFTCNDFGCPSPLATRKKQAYTPKSSCLPLVVAYFKNLSKRNSAIILFIHILILYSPFITLFHFFCLITDIQSASLLRIPANLGLVFLLNVASATSLRSTDNSSSPIVNALRNAFLRSV